MLAHRIREVDVWLSSPAMNGKKAFIIKYKDLTYRRSIIRSNFPVARATREGSDDVRVCEYRDGTISTRCVIGAHGA